MTFLNVTCSGGSGDILKKLAIRVAEHSVRDQRPKVRIAGAAIKVHPTVIVEVTIVVPHRQANSRESRIDGDVPESAIALVVVELGLRALIRQAKVILGYLAHVVIG